MTNAVNKVITQSQSGMTLLEVMIALVIFTTVSVAGYSGLHHGIKIQGQLQQRQNYWRNLESVIMLIEQDLIQARNLAPRTPIWDAQAFRGYGNNNSEVQGELLKFTRGGHQSFLNSISSPYLRIAYRLREGTLYRVTWSGLNIPNPEIRKEFELLTDVEQIQLRYLQENHRWVDRWPLRFTAEESNTTPRAVELVLQMNNNISYKRVFHVGAPR